MKPHPNKKNEATGSISNLKEVEEVRNGGALEVMTWVRLDNGRLLHCIAGYRLDGWKAIPEYAERESLAAVRRNLLENSFDYGRMVLRRKQQIISRSFYKGRFRIV